MKIFDSKSFGSIIKERRKSLGYTQEQLSANTGISMSFISDLENGKPTCELNKAIIIAKLLSMDVFLEKRGESERD